MRAWEERNPHEAEAGSYLEVGGRTGGPFYTFDEISLRNRGSWIRYEMDKLHDRVMKVRDVVPPEPPAPSLVEAVGRLREPALGDRPCRHGQRSGDGENRTHPSRHARWCGERLGERGASAPRGPSARCASRSCAFLPERTKHRPARSQCRPRRRR